MALAVGILFLWLLALTVLVGVLARQLIVVTATLDSSASGQLEELAVGVGFPIAPHISPELLSRINGRSATYLLFASVTCAPCKEVVGQIRKRITEIPEPIELIVRGSMDRAEHFFPSLPASVTLVGGEDADSLFSACEVNVTPFLIIADASMRVGAKMNVRSFNDIAFAMSEVTSGHVPRFNDSPPDHDTIHHPVKPSGADARGKGD